MRPRLVRQAASVGDEGMTLLEVLIAALLMVIVVVVMVPGLITYVRLTSDSKVRSTSTSDVQIVFERMDSEVRFAEAINQQGYGAANFSDGQKARYVEWVTPAESSPTGKALCTQWRFVPATRAIEERQWNLESTPPAVFTQRLELAIDPDQVYDAKHRPTYPFAMSSGSNSGGQPLQSLSLWVIAGEQTSNVTTQIKTKFVARNSSTLAITNDDGSGWGSLPALIGYGNPDGIYDSVKNGLVPLVCDAQVSAGGTLLSTYTAAVFRP